MKNTNTQYSIVIEKGSIHDTEIYAIYENLSHAKGVISTSIWGAINKGVEVDTTIKLIETTTYFDTYYTENKVIETIKLKQQRDTNNPCKLEYVGSLPRTEKCYDFDWLSEKINLSVAQEQINDINKHIINKKRDIYKVSFEPIKLNDDYLNNILNHIFFEIINNNLTYYCALSIKLNQDEKIVKVLYDGYFNETKESFYEFISDKKGFRKENLKQNIIYYFEKLIKSLIPLSKDNIINSLKNSILTKIGEMFSAKNLYKYILISNDYYDILTCSEKEKISSCYGLDRCHKTSVVEIFNDMVCNKKDWFILYKLKGENIDELLKQTNLSCINDTLDNITLSRRFIVSEIYKNNLGFIVAKNYGCDDTWKEDVYCKILNIAFNPIIELSVITKDMVQVNQSERLNSYADFEKNYPFCFYYATNKENNLKFNLWKKPANNGVDNLVEYSKLFNDEDEDEDNEEWGEDNDD